MNISLNANREQWKKEAEKASHDKEKQLTGQIQSNVEIKVFIHK